MFMYCDLGNAIHISNRPLGKSLAEKLVQQLLLIAGERIDPLTKLVQQKVFA